MRRNKWDDGKASERTARQQTLLKVIYGYQTRAVTEATGLKDGKKDIWRNLAKGETEYKSTLKFQSCTDATISLA